MVGLIVVLSLFIALAIQAKTHTFTFKMDHSVKGKTNFSLSKKSTNVYTTAKTYKHSNNKPTNDYLKYRISLHKKGAFMPSYRSEVKADGKKKTFKYGTIDKATYNIDLRVTNQDPSGSIYRYVKGSGQIVQ